MKKIFSICFIVMSLLQGHFIDDIAVNLVQPDGSEFSCLSSGNHYYVRLHDYQNNTIIQDGNDGYYYYAELLNRDIVPSIYQVGEHTPNNTILRPRTS